MFTYACKFRPPHWTTLPDGVKDYDAQDKRGAFGVAKFATKLDEIDAKAFQLELIEE